MSLISTVGFEDLSNNWGESVHFVYTMKSNRNNAVVMEDVHVGRMSPPGPGSDGLKSYMFISET